MLVLRLGVMAIVGVSLAGPEAHAAFSGRNGVIVYTDVAGRYGVWTTNADGTGDRLIRRGAQYAKFSRNGLRIVANDDDGRILTLRRNGALVRRFAVYSEHRPAISDDGSTIAYVPLGDHPGGVPLLRTSWFGTGTRSLVASGDFASFSSSGRFVAGSCVYTATGVRIGCPVPPSQEGVFSVRPDISPDGRRVVFERFVSAGSVAQVFIVNVDGSGLRKLADRAAGYGSGGASGPVFSPDGRRIAFARLVRGGHKPDWSLHTMDLQGTNQRLVQRHATPSDWVPRPRR